MRRPLKIALSIVASAALALAVALALTSVLDSPAGRPPNIVLILFDDLGYEGFPVYGDEPSGGKTPVSTPNIDAVAAAGVRFTQYYAAAPVCSPTRVSLLTGSYPQRVNIRKQLPLAGTARGIPAEISTLPEILRTRGYRSAHFGKWHVGLGKPEYTPLGLGFDESVVLRTLRYTDPKLQFDDRESRKVRGHSTDLLTGYAADFMRRHRDRPFFVNLWLWAPHVPTQPPGGDWQRLPSYVHYREALGLGRRDAEFATLITHADAKIGALLSTLDELGLSEDTIVIITSDNGGVEWREIDANGALRGAKGDLFEGGIRVPMVIRWPGRIPRRPVDDTLLASLDVMPTLIEAAGADASHSGSDGHSFLGLLRSDRDPPAGHDRLVWETTPCNSLDHEYLQANPQARWHDFAVRHGRWKLVYQSVVDDPATGVSRCREVPLRGPQWSLFDLEQDPREAVDLSLERPDLTEALYHDYLDWRSRIAALPLDVDAYVGPVAASGRDLIFDGGYVRLAPSALFDCHDGSFSVTARVAPAERKPQIIAQRRGSWTLGLTDNGAVELVVVDDRSGDETVLRSPQALPLKASSRVTFSIFGLKNSPAVIHLFVGEEMVAENSQSVQAVSRNMETVTLGGDPTFESMRFRGVLRDLQLRVSSLMPDEVERLDAGDL